MGDMAEYYNDPLVASYMIDDGYAKDRVIEREWYRQKSVPRCRYCKTADVKWVQTPKGWRLYNLDKEHTLHTCDDYQQQRVLSQPHRCVVSFTFIPRDIMNECGVADLPIKKVIPAIQQALEEAFKDGAPQGINLAVHVMKNPPSDDEVPY